MIFVADALINRRDKVEPMVLYCFTMLFVIGFAILMYIFIQPKVNKWFTKSPDQVIVKSVLSPETDLTGEMGIFDGLAPYLGALLLLFALFQTGSNSSPRRMTHS